MESELGEVLKLTNNSLLKLVEFQLNYTNKMRTVGC